MRDGRDEAFADYIQAPLLSILPLRTVMLLLSKSSWHAVRHPTNPTKTVSHPKTSLKLMGMTMLFGSYGSTNVSSRTINKQPNIVVDPEASSMG